MSNWHHRIWYALWPTLFLIVGITVLALWSNARLRPAIAPITQIEASPAQLPATWMLWSEPKPASWRALALPVQSTCKVDCLGIYSAWRYHFEYADQQWRDPALYLPNPDSNIAVYLNGSLIDLRGRIEAPPSVFRYQPRLIRLPQGLLRAGTNVLGFKLSQERQGVMNFQPFYLGEHSALSTAFNTLRALSSELILAGFWVQLTVFLVALGLLLRGNREMLLLWFLCAAPGWMVIAAIQAFPGLIHSFAGRPALYFYAFYALASFTPLFVTALMQKPSSTLIRAFLGYFLLGIGLTLFCQLVPADRGVILFNHTSYFLRYSMLLVIPFIIWRLFQYLVGNRDSLIANWVFAVASLTAIFGVHDVVNTGLNSNTPYLLTPLAGVGIAGAFCLELGRRILLAQARMARYSEELAEKVKAREAQLSEQFEALRQADQERTLSLERSRIMQDMHDGVGGQLAVLVHMAEDGETDRAQIIEAVRHGLSDMRLVLDSLNHAGGDLLTALGTFRERMGSMLASHNQIAAGNRGKANSVQLHWRMPTTVSEIKAGPEVVLNVFRILQEAVNNAIRHAKAKHVAVDISQENNDLLLAVSDDGIGFDPQHSPDGHHGLVGMRMRAEKIGAQLQLHSKLGTGSTVLLRLAIAQKP